MRPWKDLGEICLPKAAILMLSDSLKRLFACFGGKWLGIFISGCVCYLTVDTLNTSIHSVLLVYASTRYNVARGSRNSLRTISGTVQLPAYKFGYGTPSITSIIPIIPYHTPSHLITPYHTPWPYISTVASYGRRRCHRRLFSTGSPSVL